MKPISNRMQFVFILEYISRKGAIKIKRTKVGNLKNRFICERGIRRSAVAKATTTTQVALNRRYFDASNIE